ncbi:hypothetical protein Cgig2_000374 [Carnegiea gigantea]|uniref:Uncharacterized protein n=1 Tax=Carnegiea gigantea TaxID=171969 RepID=A0A9Q1Q409_9CARY|nr:hypothetical protein Cgig2_000374 [Carnegiea gigantea]
MDKGNPAKLLAIPFALHPIKYPLTTRERKLPRYTSIGRLETAPSKDVHYHGCLEHPNDEDDEHPLVVGNQSDKRTTDGVCSLRQPSAHVGEAHSKEPVPHMDTRPHVSKRPTTWKARMCGAQQGMSTENGGTVCAPTMTFSETEGRLIANPYDNPLGAELKLASTLVRRTLIDSGSLANIITWECLQRLKYPGRDITHLLHPIEITRMPL